MRAHSSLFGLAAILSMASSSAVLAQSNAAKTDNYADLTPQFGQKAVAWAKAETDKTRARLEASPTYQAVMRDMAKVHAGQKPLHEYHLLGGHLYMRIDHDSAHPYGRIEVANAGANGAPQSWRTVFDLDQYNKTQAHPYTFKWITPELECLAPAYDRCMISLYYNGGQDNSYIELDTRTGHIVEDGFKIAPGRNSVAWLDRNRLLVAHTTEGARAMPNQFPAELHLWKRGTPLASAPKIYELGPKDTLFDFYVAGPLDKRRIFVARANSYTSFKEQEVTAEGKVTDLPFPEVLAKFGTPAFTSRAIVVQLGAPSTINGRTYPADTVVAYDLAAHKLQVVMAPPKDVYLSGGYSGTKDGVAIVGVRNLQRILYLATPTASGWTVQQRLVEQPGITLHVNSGPASNAILLEEQGLITAPQERYLGAGAPVLAGRATQEADLSNYEVEIRSARGSDGVIIDYYLMHRKGAASGPTPTILQGYGGFGVSNDPTYFCCHLGASWKSWFDRGGAFAMAAVRGGGERGGAWHLAGAGVNKKKMFDDFSTVAEALERSGFTTPAHLGIIGHSNGGVLVSGATVLRPELYGAALIGAPVTDFSIVGHGDGGIGAGMKAEFGDWDNPEDRAIMETWDPFHNIRAGVHYPPTLTYVATTDNQVGPSHARRFVARMQDVGADAMLLEGSEGGHDYPDEYTQTSDMAMQMSWLIDTLMKR